MISVSNVRTTGGGLKIAPDADVEDGSFDVCVVGPITRGDLLRQLPHVVNGTHIGHPQVYMLRAQSLEINAAAPKALWIDGEVIGETPALFTIRQAELPIMLPPRRE